MFDRWCKLFRCIKVVSIVVMVMNGVSNIELEKYFDLFFIFRSEF